MEVVVDTHALIWYLSADRKLSKKAKKTLDKLMRGKGRLVVSMVVLMESLVLIEKKRIKTTWRELIQKTSQFPNVIFYPIGMDVLDAMRKVGKGLELHDRILVATAVVHQATLISKDSEIQLTKDVKVLW